ncbi:anti-sigma factor antagonist [Actinosynnema pretiosum subsp. pretiosum]|uniref:Anti-sigma factor antagonist n=2 Tax=Actinosynnema TaxID=40566 RepID=C6WD02_ACTMD|nr:anti-sigma factor antagonist [Actinosynnema mirum]ACU37621.1 anti-sigma-factor antagonist [Actinosynnema mirum DSM 43827]AXX31053.1 Anti-sigma F factor antagonist (spoIIAA-2), Anti-sigma B factor antagonist RsbV [Actinosynnema pretiosum subsp. pretiosum]QUF04859.1 anti-sigma factor antagonist [Actinosynnema pretiosum subsp. pretiosum]
MDGQTGAVTRESDGVLITRITGEVDAASTDPIRAEVLDQLDQATGALVLDLREVVFFGSSGISLLAESYARAQRRGLALAVVADQRAVLRPLQVTGMADSLLIKPTLDEAVEAVRAQARQG